MKAVSKLSYCILTNTYITKDISSRAVPVTHHLKEMGVFSTEIKQNIFAGKDVVMKQVSVTLSTYTADVSGVCSALYELGGMVVIHDPSGCNSTYNTHDEPRWYDMDSLVLLFRSFTDGCHYGE